MMQVINRMNKNRMMDQIEFMDQIDHTNAIGHMWGILGGYNLPIVNNKSLTFLDWFHKNFWSCGYTTPTIISNIIIKPSFALPYLSTLIRAAMSNDEAMRASHLNVSENLRYKLKGFKDHDKVLLYLCTGE